MSEIVALVDPAGAVVGSAERSVVRRDNLLHAATAVLVRDPGGRIYVHRRSPGKDWAPDHHDAAADGMLRAGEDPLTAARGELAEELGVTGSPLRPLGLSVFEDDSARSVEHCYETTYAGVVRHLDGEVVAGAWLTLSELGALLADPRWRFVPDTRALLRRLAADGVGDYAQLRGSGRRSRPGLSASRAELPDEEQHHQDDHDDDEDGLHGCAAFRRGP